MSECIIIVLQGGLGNQLFQYAAGLAMASQLGGELWLTPTQGNKHSGADHRTTLYIRGKGIGIDGQPQTEAFFNQQSDAFAPWSPSDFQGIPSIALKGFFQYLPTIDSQISLIRSELFQRLTDIRSALRQKYRFHNPRQACFLHVRRGDFTQTASNIHWIQDESYYLPALQIIKRRMSGPKRWMVISDDTAWCRAQPWLRARPFEIVDEPEELNGLMLMSMCEGGAIIGNSTFSWWGAMLGCGSQGAPVIYPSKWYMDSQPQLFPTSWTRV